VHGHCGPRADGAQFIFKVADEPLDPLLVVKAGGYSNFP
jgi:hypothetical protein